MTVSKLKVGDIIFDSLGRSTWVTEMLTETVDRSYLLKIDESIRMVVTSDCLLRLRDRQEAREAVLSPRALGFKGLQHASRNNRYRFGFDGLPRLHIDTIADLPVAPMEYGRILAQKRPPEWFRGLPTRRIDPRYLRASDRQRIRLVQGIMDTIGVIRACGEVHCILKNHSIRSNFIDLLRSVGYKPRSQHDWITSHGHRVEFVCHKEHSCVYHHPKRSKLPERPEYVRSERRSLKRVLLRRYSTPMTFYTPVVDSRAKSFLVTRGLIPFPGKI